MILRNRPPPPLVKLPAYPVKAGQARPGFPRQCVPLDPAYPDRAGRGTFRSKGGEFIPLLQKRGAWGDLKAIS
jgi:hypothetical protein